MTTKETFYLDCSNRLAFEWCRDILDGEDKFLWGFSGMIATKATREELDKIAAECRWNVEVLTYPEIEENFRLLRLSNDVIFMVRHQNKKDLLAAYPEIQVLMPFQEKVFLPTKGATPEEVEKAKAESYAISKKAVAAALKKDDPETPKMSPSPWEEFYDDGMLWFVNRLLHFFNWSIVFEVDENDNDRIISVYPSRTKWKGFSFDVEQAGYKKVENMLKRMFENRDD